MNMFFSYEKCWSPIEKRPKTLIGGISFSLISGNISKISYNKKIVALKNVYNIMKSDFQVS